MKTDLTGLQYFGTAINQHGFYLWDIKGDQLVKNNLSYSLYPFDPYGLPIMEDKLYLAKGTVRYYQKAGYSIIQIIGSPCDQRQGTFTLLFIRGNISFNNFSRALKALPIVRKIINAMPFDVLW